MTQSLRKLNATAMPRSDVQNASESQKSGSFRVSVERVVVSICLERGPGVASAKSRSSVQDASLPTSWEPVTPEQAMALASLRRCVGPLTVPSVARQLGWTDKRAARWLALFEVRGVLVRRRA